MPALLNITGKTIFWSTLLFIGVAVFTLTVGQATSYEFADNKVKDSFYSIIIPGLPIAVMLTLFGTIKMKNRRSMNISIVVLTVMVSALSFYIMINVMFSVGFNVIENEVVLFRKKDDPEIIIAWQRIGYGVFANDSHRTVQLKPFLKLWNKVSYIDTALINKNEWTFVNERVVHNNN